MKNSYELSTQQKGSIYGANGNNKKGGEGITSVLLLLES
jgi:hypothetical protein|tara:strand:- start:6411 stop:6527 length:117 start_codon:yes stop_codon:yes gene_type:complete